MKELGMSLMGCLAIGLFFVAKVYPNLQHTGAPSHMKCIDECYEEYVRVNGTVVEIEQRKRELANADEFSSIRSLWAGCAACHGADGQGMAVFPKLAGQNKDYIVSRLTAYKNREQVGPMSSTMWSQAGMLSDNDIDTIGKFIQETMK